MTTSITDARFTHLHATQNYISALLTDKSSEEDEDPWSVMPGYDEYISVPEHLDPPQMGNDDTLPSQVHPSYPYGRPEIKKNGARGPGPRALDSAATSLLSVGEKRNNEWADLNLGALLERSDGKEVPPVMAGSKRPPSPRSPQLRPFTYHVPRSQHLQRHLQRQQHAPLPPPTDQFDAPVPNETYADEDLEQGQAQQAQTPEA